MRISSGWEIFYGNDIVVVLQSAIEGVGATLLTLELKSLLNEVVYRGGEHEASRVITHISEFLNQRERSTMKQSVDYNVMVMTYDCTESKLNMAVQGFEVLIKEGSSSKNIDSICTSSVQCNSMKPIGTAYLKSVTLDEEAHVLFYSKSFEEAKIEAQSDLQGLFNTWIASGSNELHTLHKAMDGWMADQPHESGSVMHRMAVGIPSLCGTDLLKEQNSIWN
ncbi:MAG: hypothetical protein O2867_06445 [Bacteroidetes bacterium]|nr:hypothetical protein [Bacteroidota bacterium]